MHDRKLHGLLVLNAGSAIRVTPTRARSRNKVRRIDLDLVVALRTQLLDRLARLVGQVLRLDKSETNADAGRVVDRVCASLDRWRGIRPRAGLEDEVEGVVGVELQTRELGRGIVEGIGDRRQALAIAVDREVDERGRGEVELVPFEGDLRKPERESADFATNTRRRTLHLMRRLFESRAGGTRRLTLVCVVFLTLNFGASGSLFPNVSAISLCKSQNSLACCFSAETLRVQAMLTIEPGPTPDGRRSEGNSMRWTDCAGTGDEVSWVADVEQDTVDARRKSRRRFQLFQAKGDEVSQVQRKDEVASKAQRTVNLANHEALGSRVLVERLYTRKKALSARPVTPPPRVARRGPFDQCSSSLRRAAVTEPSKIIRNTAAPHSKPVQAVVEV